jgi:hypothetical protein
MIHTGGIMNLRTAILVLFLFLLSFPPLAAQENLEITYQVAFVPPFLSASVYGDSGGRNVIGSLGNGTVLSLSGENQDEWLGITFEGQAAWIRQNYVMGTVDPLLFCEDRRVMPLIESLKEAVRNRDKEAFANLIAPQGLYIGLQGHTQYLSHDETFDFFDDHRPLFWGNSANSGEPLVYSMAEDVLAYLDEDLLGENLSVACQDNQDNLSDNSVLYAVRLPNYYELPNFYSLMRPGEPGYELDWGAWGIAFSYWQGEPKIIALGHYIWTP